MDTEDVDALIAEHAIELTNDELVALHQEQEEEMSMEVREEEGEEVLIPVTLKIS